MNIRNLDVVLTLKDQPEFFPVEDFRLNASGYNELLITLFGQKVWVDARNVALRKAIGAVWCWKDHREGKHIELNESCQVCPVCGWWICHFCGSCLCNKPD